jgi:hypothetical protein
MKWVFAVFAMLLVAACAPPAPTIFDDDPGAWGAKHQDRIRSLPLLGHGGVCDLTRRKVNALGQTSAERMLRAELKRRGLIRRDIEIITDIKSIYGTGMTFTGLSCALLFEPKTNKAFYSGIGHRWQAVTRAGYVYLEGDGTKPGMRVRSWN